MGLILKKDLINDNLFQKPFSECYVTIDTYLIRKNPAFLDLTVRYWVSKEIADLSKRNLNDKPKPIIGILDPYMVVNDDLVKIPNRFSIPLTVIKDGVEDYDFTILNNLYEQSYDYLKDELDKVIDDLIIEDL